MTKFSFEDINAAFIKEAESCRPNLPSYEHEMYAIFCLGNRLDIQEIDFTRLTSESVGTALNMFQDSVRNEDDDGMMNFLRDSPWATYNYLTQIMWNFSGSDAKRAVPPFPLI